MNYLKKHEQKLTKDWRLLDAKNKLGLVKGFPTVRRSGNRSNSFGARGHRSFPIGVAFIYSDAIL